MKQTLSRKKRIILVLLLLYVGSYLSLRVASSFRDSGFEDDWSYLVVPYNETLGRVNFSLCIFYAPVLWIEETAYGELRIGRSIPLFSLE